MGILKMKVKVRVNQVGKSECLMQRIVRITSVNHHQADQQEQLTEQTHNSVESENTIEEAGEVTNVSYVVPPLTLL